MKLKGKNSVLFKTSWTIWPTLVIISSGICEIFDDIFYNKCHKVPESTMSSPYEQNFTIFTLLLKTLKYVSNFEWFFFQKFPFSRIEIVSYNSEVKSKIVCRFFRRYSKSLNMSVETITEANLFESTKGRSKWDHDGSLCQPGQSLKLSVFVISTSWLGL